MLLQRDERAKLAIEGLEVERHVVVQLPLFHGGLDRLPRQLQEAVLLSVAQRERGGGAGAGLQRLDEGP